MTVRHSIEPLEARIAPAFSAVINLGDLHGRDGFKVSGVNDEDHAGRSVSGAGDMNGDGIADFAVLAYDHNSEYAATYVVFGKSTEFPGDMALSRLDGTNGFTINRATRDAAITHVRAAGDVNGDGVGDLILGSSRADEGGSSRGAAYVVFGKTTPFESSFSLSALNGANGFKVFGAEHDDRAGGAVSGAGDIDGDGFDEIIVGAFGGNAAYVIYGKATGFLPSLALSALDGTNGFKLSSSASSLAGLGVSNAGDVNNDTFDDFIIGDAQGFFVVFGQAAGFGANVDLSSLDGTNGFKITGLDDEFNRTPNSAQSAAGDVNGDGFADIVVGNGGDDEGGGNHGAVFVIFGKAGGFPTSLPLTALDGSNGFKLVGGYEDLRLGYVVSGAGDINGDGFADIIAGAITFGPQSVAYVLFGKGNGFAASTLVYELNGQNGFKIDATPADGDFAGYSVSGAGDVNGDGLGDVLVSAMESESGGRRRGAAYVIFGKNTGGGPEPGEVTIWNNGKSAFFTDVDGDKVTLKITKGKFTPGMFDVRVEGLGGQLEVLYLTELMFRRTNLSIEAKPQNVDDAPGKEGNKLVDVGYINATDIDLGVVKVKGDLGQIDAAGPYGRGPAVKSLSVASLGARGLSTQDASFPSLHSNIAGDLRQLEVKTDIASGVTLAVGRQLGNAMIGGTVENATISALGRFNPRFAADEVAIGSLSIGGDITGSQILAGYSRNVYVMNADASVGEVLIGGDWIASNLIAGVTAGPDGFFGTDDDALIPEGNSTIAKIASILIRGSASGTAGGADHFGFVAQKIAAFKAAEVKIPLTPGPSNDLAGVLVGSTGDLKLREAGE